MNLGILRGKTVVVTGGTGSFGRKMVEAIMLSDVHEVRILSRDELKQEQMRLEYGNPKVRFHIGDVRDRHSVDQVMHEVDYVFHAAALKQVPSCEFFPMQAVMTNILGSYNVIESAIAHAVRSVIFLGTDKAVYPVNAMGMTKALMEKVIQAASRHIKSASTITSVVRYGNVMYSRGSVVPLFISQLKEGKPLTITDPNMTRFLLSLREAIGLVVFALENAQQGDLFIRKAPACTIGDLATAVKNLFQAEVPVRIIGIRRGEKMHETLATVEELRKSEDMDQYYRIPMDGRDLNYAKYFTEGEVEVTAQEGYTSLNTCRLDVEQIEELLLTLPEVQLELESWKGRGRL